MHKNLKDEPVIVAGDVQMDSPGHCAKYCVYTMRHERFKYILNMDVVDVREADGKSACMEKVGCKRALDGLMKVMNVVELVTDANSQIIKMTGEEPCYRFILHELGM